MKRKIHILVVFLLVISFLLGGQLIYRNYSYPTVSPDKVNVRTDHTTTIYQDLETGYYGVLLGESQILIDPIWHSVKMWDNNSYLVSQKSGGTLCYGIISSEQQILVPVIYSGFQRLKGSILIGRTPEDTYAFYDASYRLFMGKSFERFKQKGNLLELSAENQSVKTEIAEGNLIPLSISINCPIFRKHFLLENTELSGNIQEDIQRLEQIGELSTLYLKALFTDDFSSLFSVSKGDDYSKIIHVHALGDATLYEVSQAKLKQTDDHLFSCDTNLSYCEKIEGAEIQKSANISFVFSETEEGKLMFQTVVIDIAT